MVERIYLIGFMGTGKSTVGKGLAERLRYMFLDTDHEIETRAGMSIREIFETHGESYFRDLETEVLEDIENNVRQAVVATGGGIVVKDRNRKLLTSRPESRLIVQLTADVSTLVHRLMRDRSRPLLRGEELRTRIERLQTERAGLYDLADLTLSTDHQTPEEIIETICRELALR
jgi:shikimate kinase